MALPNIRISSLDGIYIPLHYIPIKHTHLLFYPHVYPQQFLISAFSISPISASIFEGKKTELQFNCMKHTKQKKHKAIR